MHKDALFLEYVTPSWENTPHLLLKIYTKAFLCYMYMPVSAKAKMDIKIYFVKIYNVWWHYI